jgi:hypothetical protein
MPYHENRGGVRVVAVDGGARGVLMEPVPAADGDPATHASALHAPMHAMARWRVRLGEQEENSHVVELPLVRAAFVRALG